MKWNWKKLFAGVGTVITVAAASVAIYAFWIEPRGRLYVEARSAVYEKAPEALTEAVSEARIKKFEQGLFDAARLKRSSREAALVQTEVAYFMRMQESSEAIRSLSSYYGFWKLTVANRGDRALESVVLTIPGAGVVKFKRAGKSEELVWPATDQSEVAPISFGTLQPLEEISVQAWTRSGLGTPTITHQTGIGIVDVKSREVGRLARLVDDYNGALFLIAFVIAWFLLLAIRALNNGTTFIVKKADT